MLLSGAVGRVRPAVKVLLCRALSTRSQDAKIGFIGLGQMGARMAANLVKKSGRPVLVFDLSAEAVNDLKAKGAEAATSAEQVVLQSSVIITMLPATQHVRAVLESHVLPKASKGTLIIDSSTIDPNASKDLINKAAAKGLRMVDAPVSGGVGGAEAGTLTFMVGGAKADVEDAKGVLQHMGKNVVHCGGAGTGGIAKVCNNLVLGINMVGTSEAMNLGQKLGIDPSVLASVLNTSSGRSWVTELYNPCPGVMPNAPASKGYTGGFASALMQKDLFLAQEAAKAVGAPLPAGAMAHSVYAMLAAMGMGGKDFSVVFEFLRGRGGGEQPKAADWTRHVLE